jgi:quercetin dioxygenase-like cupin family protein
VSIVEGYRFEPMVGDPDDHRPESEWSLVVDPGSPGGRVDDLAVILERIAPGDRIPLHVHRVNEVIVVHGDGTVRIAEDTRRVGDGAILFIPAGTAHGLRNESGGRLQIEAVFPTTHVWIQYLERNPAPGTESDEVSPPLTYDLRTGEVTPD